MKNKYKLPRGSILFFIVCLMLNICISLIISNYMEITHITEKVKEIYTEMIISFFILYIIGLAYWFHCRFSFIEAGRIVGASIKQTALSLILDFAKIYVVGILGGILFSLFSKKFGIVSKLNIFLYLISVFIIFITGVAMICFCLCKTIAKGRIKSLKLHDVMLIAQFIVFFVLFIEIGTYYINISTVKWVQNNKNGYKFYSLQVEDDDNEMYYDNDSKYYENVRNVLKEIDKEKDFFYMRADIDSLGANVDFAELKSHLKKDDYRAFTSSAQMLFGNVENADEPEIMENGKKTILLALCQMDSKAAGIYIKDIDKGRGFEKKDFSYNFKQKTFPIILGNKYEKYYHVGEVIRIDDIGNAKVIGFLKKNTQYYSDRTLEHIGGNEHLLDYYIIMPIFDIHGTVKKQSQKFFMQINYGNFDSGTIVMDSDSSNAKVLSVQKKINEIFRKYNLNAGYSVNSSPAIVTFIHQSEKFVNILFVLVIMIAVSNAFSFMLNITVKIELNTAKFGIQMMNGKSRKAIIAEFAIKMMSLIFIAAVIAAFILKAYFYQNILFAFILLSEAVACMILGVVVLGVKLAGTDVDVLMKTEE